jgi:hypothetical protein
MQGVVKICRGFLLSVTLRPPDHFNWQSLVEWAEGGDHVGNPLKLTAMHWAYPSVHGIRIQVPWDENQPQYGKYHFGFSKAGLTQIIAYTEANCSATDKWAIENWMKGKNPTDLHVGIDCSGFVYRVMDEAAQRSGVPPLTATLGTTCEYTSIDQITLGGPEITRAIDVQAGDAMRYNKGRHSGVIIETVVNAAGRLQEIWYAHSSWTRGPHIGWIEVGDPMAPINDTAQNWHDEMWDGLANNSLRDLYFTSIE